MTNKCTFCGRTAEEKTKYIGGYEILECCTDCEDELSTEDGGEKCRNCKHEKACNIGEPDGYCKLDRHG